MRRASLVVLAVAGCGDDSIWVEVRTGNAHATDTVELFVGVDDCQVDRDGDGKPESDCNGVQPPGFTRHLPGKVLFRDIDQPFTATVDGSGSAWFRFAASSRTVIIAAVGTSGQTVTGAALMSEQQLYAGPLHIITNLLAPDDLQGTVLADAGVKVWRTQAGLGCVGVEDRSTMPRKRVFVVPDGDADCDDVAAAFECDPLGYHAMTAKPDPADPLCVQPFGVDAGAACQLGGPTCNEATNQRSKCDPVGMCVPDGVCSSCTQTFSQDCLAEAFASANNTRMQCRFQVESDMNGGFVPCADPKFSTATFDIDGLAAFALNCVSLPQFASLDTKPYGAFAQAAVIPSGNGKTVTLTPDGLGGKCKFNIDITGKIDATVVGTSGAAGPPQPAGIIAMPFKGATVAGDRAIVLPLAIDFQSNGCTEASSCSIVPMNAVTLDKVFACGR
jgi:hypothetical protein